MIDLNKTREDFISKLSIKQIENLIKHFFEKKEKINNDNIKIKFHKNKDDYDFYIELTKKTNQNLEFKEIHRFKHQEIVFLVNEYLNKSHNVEIKKVSSGYCFYVTGNEEEENYYYFEFRFKPLSKDKDINLTIIEDISDHYKKTIENDLTINDCIGCQD